jgi:hypothetical protein
VRGRRAATPRFMGKAAQVDEPFSIIRYFSITSVTPFPCRSVSAYKKGRKRGIEFQLGSLSSWFVRSATTFPRILLFAHFATHPKSSSNSF